MSVESTVADARLRPERRPLDWRRLVQIAGACFALFAVASDAMILLFILHAMPGVGDIGRERTISSVGQSQRPGYVVLNTVLAGSPLDRAGVETGDTVAFDRPYDFQRYPHAGESIGLTVVRDGRNIHLNVTAEGVFGAPFARQQVYQEVAAIISLLVPALLGLFVLMRSKANLNTILFGMMLVVFGMSSALISLLPVGAFAAGLMAYYVAGAIAYSCIIGFAMTWGRSADWSLSKLDVIVLATSCVFILAMNLSGGLYTLTRQPQYAVIAAGVPGLLILVALVVVFGVYLAIARAASAAQGRSRQNMLLAGLGLYVLALVLWRLPPSVVALLHLSGGVVDYIYALLSGILAPTLLTYAVLRHRVIDLGFAVNRTLVYGVVSALLLTVFALIEWGVDHFVPMGGRGKNVFFDAALAVIVYLTWHRVEGFVERTIAGLFFRRWQKAESQLRQFVNTAPFVETTETLTRSFLEAVTQFAEGAPAALYVRSDDGPYRQEGVTAAYLPTEIDPNDGALIALRADPRPLELTEIGSSIEGALIAPIVNRNAVTSVLVVGPKPSAEIYRPDEINLIGWATLQVGHDLHALKVERLEATAKTQKRRLAKITSRNHELWLALGRLRIRGAWRRRKALT